MARPLMVKNPPEKPVFAWDGDCNFCRRWIERWKIIVGDKVEFVPYQDESVGRCFPELKPEQLARSSHLIEPSRQVYGGAEAVLRLLAKGGKHERTLQWYERSPFFASLAELTYRFVAANRRWISFFAGRSTGPPPTYFLSRWLFLRMLSLVYLVAFVSLWLQIDGLVGSHGILPAGEMMTEARETAARQEIGWERFRYLPTWFWIDASDATLNAVCGAGVALSILAICRVAMPLVLAGLWTLYLSLVVIGGVFLGYQWDALLLETGFLAIFLAPCQVVPSLAHERPPSPTARWLLWLLLFKLMFLSGYVKLASGDAAWANLSALTMHYETQPLPTWIGWYAHQLPAGFHEVSCAAMFGIELLVPFCILGPRRLRHIGAALLIGLQALILVTGNYCFFNWLTIALCVLLFDDQLLRRLAFFRRRRFQPAAPLLPTQWRKWVIAPVAVVLLVLNAMVFLRSLGVRVEWPVAMIEFHRACAPFHSVNGYGLFAVMTTSRPEIMIEGSADGDTWKPYEFRYKPNGPGSKPGFVAPHQPRLDWQMWFAALGTYEHNEWFMRFGERLLRGSPEVLTLLAKNPFPHQPPKFIRAVLYDYRFTDPATRRETGHWWKAELKSRYCPELSLREDAQ